MQRHSSTGAQRRRGWLHYNNNSRGWLLCARQHPIEPRRLFSITTSRARGRRRRSRSLRPKTSRWPPRSQGCGTSWSRGSTPTPPPQPPSCGNAQLRRPRRPSVMLCRMRLSASSRIAFSPRRPALEPHRRCCACHQPRRRPPQRASGRRRIPPSCDLNRSRSSFIRRGKSAPSRLTLSVSPNPNPLP